MANDLPDILQEIADVAGEEAALAIAAARGGTQVYIPPVPDIDHWLCRLIGVNNARRVAEHLTCGVGGRRVNLPLGPASSAARVRARVDAMILEGRSERDIALATRYDIRSVRRRRKLMGTIPEPRQMRLL